MQHDFASSLCRDLDTNLSRVHSLCRKDHQLHSASFAIDTAPFASAIGLLSTNSVVFTETSSVVLCTGLLAAYQQLRNSLPRAILTRTRHRLGVNLDMLMIALEQAAKFAPY